jgi:cysteine desulfurase
VAGLTAVEGVTQSGDPVRRLPHHASFVVAGARADVLLAGLDLAGVCASSGSACASGHLAPSHVLTAMGVPDEAATGALRFSLGRGSTEADVARVLALLPELIRRVREAA